MPHRGVGWGGARWVGSDNAHSYICTLIHTDKPTYTFSGTKCSELTAVRPSHHRPHTVATHTSTSHTHTHYVYKHNDQSTRAISHKQQTQPNKEQQTVEKVYCHGTTKLVHKSATQSGQSMSQPATGG